jgi:type II secretory pathway component PulK
MGQRHRMAAVIRVMMMMMTVAVVLMMASEVQGFHVRSSTNRIIVKGNVDHYNSGYCMTAL